MNISNLRHIKNNHTLFIYNKYQPNFIFAVLMLCLSSSIMIAQDTEVVDTTNYKADSSLLSLQQCINFALQNNAAIKNAELDIDAAIMTKKAAYTKFYPSISATSGAFKSVNPFVDVDMKDVELKVSSSDANVNDVLQTLYNTYGPYLSNIDLNMKMVDDGIYVGVMAVQPVYAGGRIVNGNKLANLGIDAMQLKSDLTEKDVIAKTEDAFWLVVSLQEKYKTVNAFTTLLDTLYKDVAGACEAGLTTKNDLLKVKIKQNELRSNELKLRNGIVLAKMALCQQIGLDYDENLTIAETNDSIDNPWQYAVNFDMAVENRDEAKLLNISVDVERFKEKMTRGEYLPQVGIGAAYTYNNLLDKNANNALVFATISVPISGWWEGHYNIKKQKIQTQIAANTRDNANQLLKLQMIQMWNELTELYQQVEYSAEAVEQAKDNYKYVKDYYDAGMSTIAELLEAQSLLQQSYDAYNDAVIDYRKSLTTYRLNSGITY
jgi:outer membrane protein